MTFRERVIATITFQTPDRIPVDLWCVPAVYKRYGKQMEKLLAAHPIDFPFSDGILVAPANQTFFRVGLLVISTLIAGYIPAWMIIRKNTLDSILGRN